MSVIFQIYDKNTQTMSDVRKKFSAENELSGSGSFDQTTLKISQKSY